MSEKPFPDFLNFETLVPVVFPSTMEVLLGYLRAYVSTMERLLQRKSADLHKRQSFAESSSDLRAVEEELFVVENLFPNLLRSAFFLTAYSLLENSLRQRCLCMEAQKALELSVNDITRDGGYLVQYRKYLEKVAGLNFSSVKEEWSRLLKYMELRNRVVHDQGHLELEEERHKDLKRFIKDNPSWVRLEVYRDWQGEERYYEIVFEQEFCRDVISTLKDFFCSLDAQLPEECRDLEQHFGFSP